MLNLFKLKFCDFRVNILGCVDGNLVFIQRLVKDRIRKGFAGSLRS